VIRRSVRGGPCDDGRPRSHGQPGYACATGTRASSPGGGCSVGRCACPCSRSDLPVTSGVVATVARLVVPVRRSPLLCLPWASPGEGSVRPATPHGVPCTARTPGIRRSSVPTCEAGDCTRVRSAVRQLKTGAGDHVTRFARTTIGTFCLWHRPPLVSVPHRRLSPELWEPSGSVVGGVAGDLDRGGTAGPRGRR
jgi:hypothetical protein